MRGRRPSASMSIWMISRPESLLLERLRMIDDKPSGYFDIHQPDLKAGNASGLQRMLLASESIISMTRCRSFRYPDLVLICRELRTRWTTPSTMSARFSASIR